jgi:hypothetical protein
MASRTLIRNFDVLSVLLATGVPFVSMPPGRVEPKPKPVIATDREHPG